MTEQHICIDLNVYAYKISVLPRIKINFRDAATHIIAVSGTFHSSKPNVLCGSELIVDHKTQMQNW